MENVQQIRKQIVCFYYNEFIINVIKLNKDYKIASLSEIHFIFQVIWLPRWVYTLNSSRVNNAMQFGGFQKPRITQAVL